MWSTASRTIKVTLMVFCIASPAYSDSLQTSQSNIHSIEESIKNLPLAFEKNQGQFDSKIKYASKGLAYNVLLTDDGATIDFKAQDKRENDQLIAINFDGASKPKAVDGKAPLSYKTNYFLGQDTNGHVVDVNSYGRVEYPSVYPGVDLAYYGTQQQLEYDLIVAPGADPSVIKLNLGAEKVSISSTGDLILSTKLGGMVFRKPIAYQEKGSERQLVSAEYVLDQNNRISFKLGAYDTKAPLIIDPILNYSSYLWGGVSGVATDTAGNIYAVGTISANELPVVGGYSTSLLGSTDAFVIKMDPAGSKLIYATYLGARRAITNGNAIAVDSAGNAYVTGITNTASYPVTTGAYQTKNSGVSGYSDGFITKLNAAGNALVYSSYIKGTSPKTIAIDTTGNVYLGGAIATVLNTFVVTPGAFNTSGSSCFVAKLNPAGSAMVYSTYIGGSGGSDVLNGLATDSGGNAYVVGTTLSTNYPVVNAYQSTNNGGHDVFVSKLNPTGTALVFSTYIGGSLDESGNAIAVDPAGYVYIVGTTNSSNYPKAAAFQSFLGYPSSLVTNAFITKFSPDGTNLVYSTYMGGKWCLARPGASSCSGASPIDGATVVTVDSLGYAYVGGFATSYDFPMFDSINQLNITGSNDNANTPFVAKISPTGGKIYSTALVPRQIYSYKQAQSIAVDSQGNLIVASVDSLENFENQYPLTPTPLKTTPSSNSVASAISKISTGNYPTILSAASISSHTFNLTANFQSLIAGGTISFMDGNNVIGTVSAANGSAMYTATLTNGVHKLTAVYSGDSLPSKPIYLTIHSYQ